MCALRSAHTSTCGCAVKEKPGALMQAEAWADDCKSGCGDEGGERCGALSTRLLLESEFRFSPFEKVPESSAAWSHGARRELTAADWVVSEKVHGAHFVFVVLLQLRDGEGNSCEDDGAVEVEVQTVLHAKRTALLEPSEYFFGYRSSSSETSASVAERYDAAAEALACELLIPMADGTAKDEQENVVQRVAVYIHGELFGPTVQAGVDYLERPSAGHADGPLEFMAFDVAVQRELADPGSKQYLDVDVANALLERHGFFYARTLFKGSFEQVTHFNIRFDSTLPALLADRPGAQMSVPATGTNLAEGVVVRPVKADCSRMAGGDGRRLILKLKNPEYSETRYTDNSYCAASQTAAKAAAADASRQQDAAALAVELEMMAKITEQRIATLVSKLGKVAQSDSGDEKGGHGDDGDDSRFQNRCRAFLKAYRQDILGDLLLESEDLHQQEGKSETVLERVRALFPTRAHAEHALAQLSVGCKDVLARNKARWISQPS